MKRRRQLSPAALLAKTKAQRANGPVWWCSWYFPQRFAADTRISDKWPENIKAWISGSTLGDRTTAIDSWVARVEAPSAEAAMKAIRDLYGELAEHVEERWAPIEKPPGWQTGDRFR